MLTRRLAPTVLALVVFAATALVATAGSAAPQRAASLRGTLQADGGGVAGATVELVRAGSKPGNAKVLQTVSTGRKGAFTLTVPANVKAGDVLYVVARGGPLPSTVELAAALGDVRSAKVTVNELTTVAAGYALAQFAEDGALGGKAPGLPNAAKMTRNLVDRDSGQLARFFTQSPNGTDTEALGSFNSLASIIAGCVAGTNDCDAFLDAATDAWGVRPATTWQAMTLLPTNPAGDAPGVFDQLPDDPRFEPVRADAPDAWTIALRFYGNGRQFNGPGNVAFDAQGRVWVNNNAEPAKNPRKVCPGLEIYRLNPFAPGRPMETFTGGGLNGAGFGIALDPEQNVWVGNFGFTGRLCNEGPPTSNSVSEFAPDGTALSPDDGGYQDGPLSWPQGVKSDTKGNIWIANCGSDSLAMYPGGDNTESHIVATGISRAFDVAQNADGNVIVTANSGDEVFAFNRNGEPVFRVGDSTMFSQPLGAASDSLGNVWVANSGVVVIPCKGESTIELPSPEEEAALAGTVTQVGTTGSLARYGGAGLTIPWGIAVDGEDNIWVANFSGQRLSHLCGARVSTCPSGVPGAEISPTTTGYPYDGLQRNTGVQVDPSGNVWLANNWIAVPFQIDPFGDGLVAYLGVAAPVKAPLVGTPQQP